MIIFLNIPAVYLSTIEYRFITSYQNLFMRLLKLFLIYIILILMAGFIKNKLTAIYCVKNKNILINNIISLYYCGESFY